MNRSALLALALLLAACSSPTPATPRADISLYSRDKFVVAVTAMHKQQYAEAEAAAGEALQDSPGFTDAAILRAEALLKLGERADSEELLSATAASAPDRPEPPLLLGMLKEVDGDLPGAIDLYQQSREKYDTDTLAREQAAIYIAASYLARGRLAGFDAVRLAQDKFPDEASIRQLYQEISADNRAFFLERVKPHEAPESKAETPAKEGS